MSKSTTEIGQFLTEARESKGISQRQAANESGVSQSLISFYECGKVSPKLGNLQKLCRLYGKTLMEATQAITVPPDQ